MKRRLRWRPHPQLAAVFWAPMVGLLAACQPPTAKPQQAPVAAASHAGAVDARMAGELDRASERANVCSVRNVKAAGLTAEYFGAKGFAGPPLLTRQEGPIDGDWPVLGQDVKTPVRSARWRGWIRPPFTGSFSFHAELPGAQITVAGKRLTSADDKISLNAGRFHPIQVELSELPAPSASAAGGQPPLKLSWTTPFGARYLLPKAVLFPPSDTVDRSATDLKTVSRGAGK